MARRQTPKVKYVKCDDCGLEQVFGVTIFDVTPRLGGGRICLACRTDRLIKMAEAERDK